MKLFAEPYLDEDASGLVAALLAMLLNSFAADEFSNQLLYV